MLLASDDCNWWCWVVLVMFGGIWHVGGVSNVIVGSVDVGGGVWQCWLVLADVGWCWWSWQCYC